MTGGGTVAKASVTSRDVRDQSRDQKIILYRDRDRDPKKNFTGTEKKLPGPTLESEAI